MFKKEDCVMDGSCNTVSVVSEKDFYNSFYYHNQIRNHYANIGRLVPDDVNYLTRLQDDFAEKVMRDKARELYNTIEELTSVGCFYSGWEECSKWHEKKNKEIEE